ALYWFAAAAASDGLDGFLARRCGWTSRLGSHLDPIADKLLLLSAYAVFGWQGLLPADLVYAVFVRDGVIVAGATLYWRLRGPFDAHPLLLSKVNTALQILLVAAVMYSQGIKPVAAPMLNFLVVCTFVTTALSGLLYVLLWSERYRRESRAGRN
ncbi:CDP-alcohol phosphatidyltransferase family protein, partial [Methylogaea oryzae]